VFLYFCPFQSELNNLIKVAETDLKQAQSFCSVCNMTAVVPTFGRNWVKGWSRKSDALQKLHLPTKLRLSLLENPKKS
jgi:hypothetical protein